MRRAQEVDDMDLVLYTAAQSRGLLVQWLLEELALPYRTVVLDLGSGEHKEPGYRQLHPLGVVPVLLVNGEPLIESLAICLFLADAVTVPSLAPPISAPQRAAYLQWMVYATSTIEPELSAPFVRSLSLTDRQAVSTSQEREAFARVLTPLSTLFERGQVLSQQFSAADIVLGCELYWAEQVGLLRDLPGARLYLERLQQRPSWGRLWREGPD
jgi:glutathione S-transferase